MHSLTNKHNPSPQPLAPIPTARSAALALLLALAPAQAASLPSFSILSDDQGGWPLLLQSVGFMPQPAASARCRSSPFNTVRE